MFLLKGPIYLQNLIVLANLEAFMILYFQLRGTFAVDISRQIDRRTLCPLWYLHPHIANSNCCQQFCKLLQKQAVEK